MANTDFFEAKFPFIADNLFLVAWVGKLSGKQRLKIQKINHESRKIEFEDILTCIHTAITTISYETFLKVHEDEESAENFAKDMINARTTESLQKVNLSPEEHFFALKSWVQGITEAGLDAFNLQTNIEAAAQFQYPIETFLLKSLMKIRFDYIGLFLENIKKNCKYEGIYHKPSLRANFNVLLRTLTFYSGDKTKFDAIFEILREIAELDSEFLFRESDTDIRQMVAENPNATQFEEYKELFEYPNSFIKRIVAGNPNATQFEENKKLFYDNPEYKWEIRRAIAGNPNATQFEEYKKLFYDKYWEVRRAIAGNPNATQFEEYKKLIPNEIATNKIDTAKNPLAVQFEEYNELFKDKDWKVRQAIVNNPNARKLEDYKTLFSDYNLEVRKAVLENIKKICYYGIYHQSSLRADLKMLFFRLFSCQLDNGLYFWQYKKIAVYNSYKKKNLMQF